MQGELTSPDSKRYALEKALPMQTPAGPEPLHLPPGSTGPLTKLNWLVSQGCSNNSTSTQ